MTKHAEQPAARHATVYAPQACSCSESYRMLSVSLFDLGALKVPNSVQDVASCDEAGSAPPSCVGTQQSSPRDAADVANHLITLMDPPRTEHLDRTPVSSAAASPQHSVVSAEGRWAASSKSVFPARASRSLSTLFTKSKPEKPGMKATLLKALDNWVSKHQQDEPSQRPASAVERIVTDERLMEALDSETTSELLASQSWAPECGGLRAESVTRGDSAPGEDSDQTFKAWLQLEMSPKRQEGIPFASDLLDLFQRD